MAGGLARRLCQTHGTRARAAAEESMREVREAANASRCPARRPQLSSVQPPHRTRRAIPPWAFPASTGRRRTSSSGPRAANGRRCNASSTRRTSSPSSTASTCPMVDDGIALQPFFQQSHCVHAVLSALLLTTQGGLLARIVYATGLITEPSQIPELVFDRNSIGTILDYILKEVPFMGIIVLAVLQGVGRGARYTSTEYDGAASCSCRASSRSMTAAASCTATT